MGWGEESIRRGGVSRVSGGVGRAEYQQGWGEQSVRRGGASRVSAGVG